MPSMSAFLLRNRLTKSLIVNGEILRFDITGNSSDPASLGVYRPMRDTGVIDKVNLISCLKVEGYSDMIEVACILNEEYLTDFVISAGRYDVLKKYLRSVRATVLRFSPRDMPSPDGTGFLSYKQTFYAVDPLKCPSSVILKILRGN